MKSTQRFSSNVEDYIKYRPGYTQELIAFLGQACGSLRGQAIADIGSGTGKLTEPLLNAGGEVYAVEPNQDMRQAAESMLQDYKDFHSIDGTAESTELGDRRIDAVVAAQAYHWFDPQQAKLEFKRILKDQNGYVFLIWNNRNNEEAFMKQYESFLLQYSTDYSEINHKNITGEEMHAFFRKDTLKEVTFENDQHFDFIGLKGRYDSCSYALPDTHELYPESISSLQSLYDQYCIEGKITMCNSTVVYYGQL
ncbi:MAG: class I SAM-dependent methyltransferase [Flavobacteriales bacterium]|nr:class I SAM-dependent methyltransferase [Flavobacteriales bacterium]